MKGIAIAGLLAVTLSLGSETSVAGGDFAADMHALKQIREGRDVFRYSTFGDEDFWGGTLGLHEAVATVSPKTALSVGLKVDVDSLSRSTIRALQRGKVNLNDPAVTRALLRANAVVGLTGFFSDDGKLSSIGIQCALCHSTVDDSLAPGIGNRRDGWANRDLNIGAIVALAPRLQPLADLLGVDVATVKKVLGSWGPGKFDAELFIDGKAFQPDGRSAATLIPPAFGLAGVNLHTWTGWGSVTHWNAFVANLEMHGKGTFIDSRLNDAAQFPVAARAGFGEMRAEEDLITPALGALQLYQLALPAPRAPRGSYDRAAAAHGEAIFNDKAKCDQCHVPPLFTEPGWNMHTPEEIGIDAFQANRSPDKHYRTSPLRGLWTHQRGGFYHDGRFATLADVIAHYDRHFGLNLSPAEKQDLEQYLRSL
jgi:cytochrome c peroxidase